ncbi:MAG TPA: hypothetical protein PKD17_12305 [Cellvibrionaceae bacterium]|nr:hypothetical protein [Cellvibrionaceae bacterium]HMW72601.1 hypothetical protein [Cellvibrionaceae bacterium]HMY37988.1 hypothetical protein [Marinagarivorans sp.]HNG61306.1 hypothetical protein [Cellvibrionaceae bacterium]
MNPSDLQTVEEIGAIPLPESFMPRGVMPPVPPAVNEWLDQSQQLSLRTMEYFGWQLWFIRRQQLPAIVVIRDGYSQQFAVLEPGGQINQKPHIQLRADMRN